MEPATRTTVALDDKLVRAARELTGMTGKTSLLREALRALIERKTPAG
ncbi:MAG: type II toxin-antitoxin system VapB family antitoxin [Candidatus Sulfotelmatobacter sp.]|jgi:Arc/MetJ family transcription regulator